MNVLEARVALRERTLLDVVDLSLRFVMSHLGAYARVSLAVLLPGFLGSWAIAAYFGWIWGWTGAVLLGMVASAPFTALASRLVFAPRVGTGDALRIALGSLARMIACRLMQILGVTTGVIFFVVPGTWVAMLFFLVSEVVVLEQASVGTAVTRLGRLLAGHSGQILMALLALNALTVAAVFLGDIVGRAVLEDLLQVKAPVSLFEAGGSPLGLLGFWLALPVLTTSRLFVYLDLRTRREGWDIQTRFAAISARGRGESEVRA